MTGGTVKKPILRQLNVQNYEFNQIQSFSNQALSETTRYIDSQSTKKTVVKSKYLINFPINVAQRNAYLTLSEKIYDPFNAYDTQSGVFTSQMDSVVQVSCNILLTIAGAGTVGLFLQRNKSTISPQATQGTNYDALLDYQTFAAAGSFVIQGSKYIDVVKGDDLRIFLFSSVDNPSIAAASNDIAQVSFAW